MIKFYAGFAKDLNRRLELLNYLKAADKEVGLLLNFGSKLEIKRKV